MTKNPIALVILDGWGYNPTKDSNAIEKAHKPNWDKLWRENPHGLLKADGTSVGLPEGQMGNSEVGHLTMGLGRTLEQDLTRITKEIQNSNFSKNEVLIKNVDSAIQQGATIHILGLLSNGGVHSSEDHIFALIELLKKWNAPKVIIHPFLDGRDTPPKSALSSLQKLTTLCNQQIKIGSISGRYYAMDRDKRYDRTEQVYQLLTTGQTKYQANNVTDALFSGYDRGETDEFISPTRIDDFSSIQNNDLIVFMNFRADRARQLSFALTDPNFSGFKREACPRVNLITLTQYAENLNAQVLYPSIQPKNSLGQLFSDNHLRQLRIAETEKYAHVTYFFDGGKDIIYPLEDRILIPSKKVSTYDLCPAMSANEITTALVDDILAKNHDVIICNYANADMVGHTGNYEATIKAIEVLDHNLGKLIQALEKVDGDILITADHGNAECMYDTKTNQPHTAHTNNLVPFLFKGRKIQLLKEKGSLADIAASMLTLLNLPIPIEMTGSSLLAL